MVVCIAHETRKYQTAPICFRVGDGIRRRKLDWNWQMRNQGKKSKSPLPVFNEFAEKFRRAFGREVTREERRFYRLINIVLREHEAAAETDRDLRANRNPR